MTARNTVARLLHVVSAGRITLVDDTGSVQKLQVSERPGADGSPGVTDGVVRIAQFGFASSPPLQSDVVLVRLWGNRTLTIALGTAHQPSRLKNLQAGDSALYDVRGAYAWFKAAGLVIDAAGLNVTIQNAANVTVKATTLVRVEAPKLECTGDVVANCDGSAISLATHLHSGVETGAAESGPPVG